MGNILLLRSPTAPLGNLPGAVALTGRAMVQSSNRGLLIGTGGGGGGSTNVNAILGYQTFNGGTIGNTPGVSNPVTQSVFNLTDGGNTNTAFSKYSNAVLDTGFTTVMAQAMPSGSDAPTWGFGFDWTGSGRNGFLTGGDECWMSMRVYIPTGFSFATSDGALKWMRVYTQNTAGSDDGYDDALWGTGAGTSNNNWIGNFEGNPLVQNFDSPNTHNPPIASWTTYDFYIKFGTTTATGILRFWINKVQVGGDMAVQTMINSNDQATLALFGTYWNGGAPQNQTIYTSMCAVACNCAASGRRDQTVMATDTNGKPLIALGF